LKISDILKSISLEKTQKNQQPGKTLEKPEISIEIGEHLEA
jgi:hypothetical protein